MKKPEILQRHIRDFYRILSLAAADNLPSYKSEYRKLKVKGKTKDIELWALIEKKIINNVADWPEWSASMNFENTASKLKRYKSIGKSEKNKNIIGLPARFKKVSKQLEKLSLQYIEKSIKYSLKRFASHSDYQNIVAKIKKNVDVKKLQAKPQALPLLDMLKPSRLSADIVTLVKCQVEAEINDIRQLKYPFQRFSNMNLALILRVQVQVKEIYRDRFSKLVGAAQNRFQSLFEQEIIKQEILPQIWGIVNSESLIREII